MEILLTQSVQSYLFPLAWDKRLRLDSRNKPKQHNPIKRMRFTFDPTFKAAFFFFFFTVAIAAISTGFLTTLEHSLRRRQHRLLRNLNNDSERIWSRERDKELSEVSEQILPECVSQLFKLQWAMSAAVYTAQAGRRSLWRSCFSQACVVCMCVPAHSDLPHGWLVGIPASLCNYGSSPGLSALLSLHLHTLTGRRARTLFTWSYSPGPNLAIIRRRVRMHFDNHRGQQLWQDGRGGRP